MNQSVDHINLTLIQQGNHIEFARLMEVFSDALYVFAKGILNNGQVAEEVVSDVFVRLWESRNKMTDITNLKSYLYSAVRNQAISFIRKQNKDLVSLEDINHYYFEPVEPVEEGLIQEEKLQKIYKAIDYLPAQTKMVFSLAKVQGLKYKEIADVLEISVKTVDYHVASAIKKICESIDKDNSNNSEQVLKAFLALLMH